MADSERRRNQAQPTDAPATTSAVVDGVAPGVPEVDSNADITSNVNRASNVNIPSASIAYSPEDLESQRASPIEVDKYLSQEENWCAVKQEMGLEERTALLSLHDQNGDFQEQSLPSTSSQGFFPSRYAPHEGETSGGASYTDMSSTMRVTREATNALYSDPLLPAHSHIPSELTQYLSRSALDPREAGIEQRQEYPGSQQAQDISRPYAFPFMNTPSPSDGSEGSQAGIASPHISPQPQVQTGYHGMGAQGQASQQGHNSSPTFISLMDDSPPAFLPSARGSAHKPHLNNPSPTYNLVPENDSPPLYDMTNQRVPPYNFHLFQDQQTPPSYVNVPSRPPPVSRSTHVSPHTTPPLSSPGHPTHHQEEPKIRNGKMYTSYLNHNGHSGYIPSFERQNRHPSGPAPPPGGHARVYPTGQYSQPNNVYPLPEVSLSRFFPGYESASPQLSQSAQAQSLPSFGSQAPQNYGNQSSAPPPRTIGPAPGTVFSYYYTSKGPAAAPCGRALGGARRRTTSTSSNGGNRAQTAGNEGPSAGGNILERERVARRAARRLSRVPGKRRKRGCTCYRCQIVFASSGHLKRHMEAHGSNRRFKCEHPYCDVAYSRQDNLKNHVEKAIHRQEGDPYDIPVSDLDDSECEVTDYGYFSCESDLGNFEPEDDSDEAPPGGPGPSGGGGVGGVGVVF